jgi:hypothetical protein
LTWKPEDYEGIKGIFVDPDLLWTPKLFINNSHYTYGLGSCHPQNCLIKFDSQVACLIPCQHSARCNGDFADWPFDIQTCSIVFKTFLTHENVTLDPSEMGGTMTSDSSKRWEIIEAKAKMPKENTDNVKITFVIQRYSEMIYKNVHVPGIVLITLTLAVLLMKSGSLLRSVISGTSIYLHFNLMDRVWWQ